MASSGGDTKDVGIVQIITGKLVRRWQRSDVLDLVWTFIPPVCRFQLPSSPSSNRRLPANLDRPPRRRRLEKFTLLAIAQDWPILRILPSSYYFLKVCVP